MLLAEHFHVICVPTEDKMLKIHLLGITDHFSQAILRNVTGPTELLNWFASIQFVLYNLTLDVGKDVHLAPYFLMRTLRSRDWIDFAKPHNEATAGPWENSGLSPQGIFYGRSAPGSYTWSPAMISRVQATIFFFFCH